MHSMMINNIKNIRISSRTLAEWGTFITALITCFAVFIAWGQLKAANEQLAQGNEQKKWQNYNELNVRYAELYEELPPVILKGEKLRFDDLKAEEKRWVRQYFDLYSEELWLYENDLIPAEMWTKRIHCGVRVNLKTYPALIDGYYYWKGKGSFSHPKSFKAEVENAISFARSDKVCKVE